MRCARFFFALFLLLLALLLPHIANAGGVKAKIQVFNQSDVKADVLLEFQGQKLNRDLDPEGDYMVQSYDVPAVKKLKDYPLNIILHDPSDKEIFVQVKATTYTLPDGEASLYDCEYEILTDSSRTIFAQTKATRYHDDGLCEVILTIKTIQ